MEEMHSCDTGSIVSSFGRKEMNTVATVSAVYGTVVGVKNIIERVDCHGRDILRESSGRRVLNK